MILVDRFARCFRSPLMSFGWCVQPIGCLISQMRLRRLLEALADLPVMAEGVDDAAYAPGVFRPDGADDGGSGCDGAVEGGVGVFDGKDHADGAAIEGLGAEVFVLGGFVGDPEAVAVDG